VLQWDRVQSVVFMGAALTAVYAIVACLGTAEPEHTELFHIYYQPLLVMLAMLWMWGVNVRVFERRRIAYGVCFSVPDQQFLRSSQQLFQARKTPTINPEKPSICLCCVFAHSFSRQNPQTIEFNISKNCSRIPHAAPALGCLTSSPCAAAGNSSRP
jgi:hypothetical protein